MPSLKYTFFTALKDARELHPELRTTKTVPKKGSKEYDLVKKVYDENKSKTKVET